MAVSKPQHLPPRYIFIGGLHRSGTSLLARLIAAHPEVSALHAPDVPEGEGAYVQGAIPHTAQHGIPGAFAFDPAQHMTEAHSLNTEETRSRLEADWSPRFDRTSRNRLEKSPVNLLRSRLYQALFPMAHFIFVTRHPVAVAQATAKWSDAPFDRLIAHWGRAHALAFRDLPYLHAALVLRYEDLCADPASSLRQIWAFLSLPPHPAAATIQNGNAKYRERTCAMPHAAAALGYTEHLHAADKLADDLRCRHPLKSVRLSVLEAATTTSTFPQMVAAPR